jgi:hypothetical protein
MKYKFDLSVTLLTLSLAALACVTSPESVTESPAATQPLETQSPITEVPVSTAVPTLPPPTATLEATATAVISNPTPAVTLPPPTPDPNLNVGDEIYNDSFDGKSGWFWTFEDSIAAFGAKDGELKIETRQGNNSWRYVIRDDFSVGDQQLRIVAKTVTCPGNDEYGIMYRGGYQADGTLQTYIFKLNCAGQAQVVVLENVLARVLKDWETYPAIRPGAPSDNTITIWMQKDQFHFYVNDQYLFSVIDSTRTDGFYGFYAQSHSNGGGSIGLDDFVVKEILTP